MEMTAGAAAAEERTARGEEEKQVTGRAADAGEGDPPATHRCGGAEDRERASKTHWMRHWRKKEKPCPKALAEAAWAEAERRAGEPLPDWAPRRAAFYECGGAGERTAASNSHYRWHRWRGEKPCPKSLAEAAWAEAARVAGEPLPDWEPRKEAHHECGGAEARKQASSAHYLWHRRRGEEPCPKARAEANWRQAEKRAGKPLPGWEPTPRGGRR